MPSLSLHPHRRQRGQNAILDRGLATILATVAIVGALASYFLFAGNSDAQAQQSQLTAVTAQIANLYGNQSTFTGLTAAQIAGSGALSPQWVTGTGTSASIVSIFKSPVVLAPIAHPYTSLANGAYTLTITNVPPAACISLASTNIGSGELGIAINGAGGPGTTAPLPGVNPLPTPAAAQTACSTGNNTLVYTMS